MIKYSEFYNVLYHSGMGVEVTEIPGGELFAMFDGDDTVRIWGTLQFDMSDYSREELFFISMESMTSIAYGNSVDVDDIKDVLNSVKGG